MSAFESISKGLNEALAHAEGTNTDSQTHEVKVPQVNVCEVRHATGLSQIAFARRIGVAKGTLVNWEQGRRHPTGPAQVLLALIAKNPNVVQDLLEKR